jgi:long-chain acyl-CoA synthetase
MRDVIRRETSCERVGLMLPSSAAFPAALFGVLWASRVAVPLNFLLRAEELAGVVRDAQIDLILTIGHFRELAGKLPARAVCLEDLSLKKAMFWTAFRRLPGPPRPNPHDSAVILYTSGTTAEPKGVELTYGNLHSSCVDSIESLEIDPRQSFLNVLPPFHVFGLTANVLVPVFLAAPVYALPRFNALHAIRLVGEKRLSVVLAIPSMFAAMLRTKSTSADAFKSIYLAISGGEPLPDSVRDGFEQRFGVTLRQGYGLTETSPVVSACSVPVYRAGTVGRPIRHVEVRLIGADGADVASGEDGEVLVRGPNVMKGYFHKPQETAKVIDAQGWFHTGDIGRFDADGFLSITGRIKDMLIVGGENVYPREIEAVLEMHEAVLQAAVIGVPDGLRGEVPVAFVIPRQGASVSGDDLRAFARQRLASHKTPRQIEVRDDLPTGPTGKILKRKLRELL